MPSALLDLWMFYTGCLAGFWLRRRDFPALGDLAVYIGLLGGLAAAYAGFMSLGAAISWMAGHRLDGDGRKALVGFLAFLIGAAVAYGWASLDGPSKGK